MKLTNQQKANLFHILVVFPLIYITVYPDTVASLDPDVLRKLVTFIMIAGTMYHIYKFMDLKSDF
jgi:hypothetical protein